jgi:crotonobetainyl-CoA:carnitine CoA-transferase CaiB-like acyl-CoA transferase
MLEDVSVLDLSLYLPGSYASLLLGDLGAEVVKVERPPDGEVTRDWEPNIDGVSYRFLQRNRNKRSICLDLTSDAGLEVFYDLVSDVDVVIEGFRPGVLGQLDAGYEDVSAINPDVLFCSITGYGQDGPLADTPGHDLNYASLAGFLGTTKVEERPVVPGVPIGDLAGGLFAAFSVISALRSRSEYGGQHIDIAITDVLVSWLIPHTGEHFGTNGDYDPSEAITSSRYPCYSVYATADGRYIAVGAIEFPFWERFCELLSLEDLIDGHRSEENREQRLQTVQQTLVEKPRSEWLGVFEDEDVPVTPVNSIEEAVFSPHVQHRGLLETVKFGGSDLAQVMSPFGFSEYDVVIDRAPPRLGADNEAILKALGYDQSERVAVTDGTVIR